MNSTALALFLLIAIPGWNATQRNHEKGSHCQIRRDSTSGFIESLVFTDSTGREIKRLSPSQFESKPDSKGSQHFHERKLFVGCKAGHFAAVLDRKGEIGAEGSSIRSKDTLLFYSSDGQILWRKTIPSLGFNQDLLMSDDDQRVWYLASGRLPTTMGTLDSNGRERRFDFPSSVSISNLSISANGRCASAVVQFQGDGHRVEFIDLNTGKQHEFHGLGKARCSDSGRATVTELIGPGSSPSNPPHLLDDFQF